MPQAVTGPASAVQGLFRFRMVPAAPAEERVGSNRAGRGRSDRAAAPFMGG